MVQEQSGESKVPLLELVGISKNYGGVKALIESDFKCGSGEVHAVLGENGAGKSTLLKILCGVVKKDTGVIRLRGEQIEINSPNDAEKHGIAAVFQELSLVQDLSVAENIYIGREPKNKYGLVSFSKMNEMAEKLFEELGLHIQPEAMISDLPLAQQQLVEIAKALSKNPDIIIFDEATSALGSEEVKILFSLIKKLTAEGKTAIFISHRMDELEQIADYATVFRDARYITTFKWGTVSNEQIINWIAGRKLEETYPKKNKITSDNIALEISHLSSGRRLKNIDLQVKEGEILGIAGLQGHGQSQFLRALFGAYPIQKGEVKIFGRKVHIKSPEEAIKAGIVLVPEDRKNEGLLLPRSVRENLATMVLKQIQNMGLLSTAKENSMIHSAVEMLKIKTPNLEQAVVNLSGGNQQKVVIGKALLTEAKIILLADPTRGIDVGTKAEIYQLMNNLAKEGNTILFYSTELAELVGVCNRVIVFKEGRINGELTGADIDEHSIINAALGIA
ncbi:sugar ABC transporter ATP-binding protein [Petroclostridium sp. X23]|uniref:sugar ABC transporter ATP-binding protein n=1 Tax=Petroclostridium sp. X23 TaxID=3045146 RepID=UPI0024AD07E3|nr:sugar ABC transporter ATP-binding protein [Petroclostridium sp. X23]WHH60371.1 sugar ABC transporter ATP-binding protein [Petroclostridium sp. X23]